MDPILVGAVFCLFASAFFSGAEIVLVTVNRVKLQHQVEEGDQRSIEVMDLLEHPDALLSAILIGNNVANTTCAALTTLYLTRELSGVLTNSDYIPLVTSLIVTPLVLITSEILPKNLGRRFSNTLVYLIDRPIRLMIFLLAPAISVIKACTRVISSLIGLNQDGSHGDISREDFIHSLRKTVVSGQMQEETQKMIQSTIDFRETSVREIMVPLTEVRAISGVNTKVQDLLAFARRNFYTRYPVYMDRIDHVTGYVNIYDVLAHKESENQAITDFIQPIDYVPNTLRIDKLFFRMQKNRQKIVVAVDEYGGCDGIVTIEDIMEELVGDIAEDHEEFEPMIRSMGDNDYLIDASIDIDNLNDELELELPKEGYETLAGFLISVFERIPEEGDSFFIEEMYFEILETERLAITKVKLSFLDGG